MMTNLFSTFDPCTGFMSLNWLSTMLMVLLMNYNYWLTKNNMKTMIFNVTYTLQKEMSMIMPYKGSNLLFISMFMMILMNNTMGMLPYVFTSSSQLVFSMALSLPMWLTLMTFGWLKKTNFMFSHLVPIGTPTMLMPFMVIIESISNMIRPGSLAVRLSANMIAGHLLMSLLGSSMSTTMMMILVTMLIMLMMFEVAVSIIQSYVFMTLSTLYSSEI
uniref:ATP synthase subunit a n=1 Tax=Entylia carinata TaxID=1464891 RepID=A0A343AXP4_ENTCR|nr:ATP synthase F0 subunit 6 [Entylia carinata]APU51892.1 ATP synthase F0 subunit 6 [Entylia carinata]